MVLIGSVGANEGGARQLSFGRVIGIIQPSGAPPRALASRAPNTSPDSIVVYLTVRVVSGAGKAVLSSVEDSEGRVRSYRLSHLFTVFHRVGAVDRGIGWVKLRLSEQCYYLTICSQFWQIPSVGSRLERFTTNLELGASRGSAKTSARGRGSQRVPQIWPTARRWFYLP